MNDSFVYGFLFAVVVISGLLALQYGNDFSFLDDKGFNIIPSFGTALNWKSAICLSIFFGLFFRNLGGTLKKRLFAAFWILCLGWAFMDFFWILKACVCGNFLFGSTTLSLIDVKGLWIGLLRNSLMSSVALLFIMDYLKISKQCLFAFAGVAGYWIFMICSFPYSGFFFSSFVVYSVNFLPFIIAFKSWSGKSWRNFLFA